MIVEITQHGWVGLLFALLIGHALADYALQTSFISKAKCPCFWEGKGTQWNWVVVLAAHSLIHAGMVWIVTGMMWIALVELTLHFMIDKLKCDERFGFRTDQGLHVLCKAMFVVVIFVF